MAPSCPGLPAPPAVLCSVVAMAMAVTALLGLASHAVQGAAADVHGVRALVVPQQRGDPDLGRAVAHLILL
eukprot:CAMPEP_0202865068 /NCGR_PEP_ID=MMETSP1391-20130828/5191_1 /ASSEMBLY_ACC=CAM_ASM_000867 /TAXON_ID=1034604 /ORGANISM="Chlamydomonas leiostraca, Strain SAG 11-49" /LENGTH=70 /DNA_ID=CAMNT_0049544863 /DNA_START=318 /DNA_END=530 /DNA_ORIENTATION=-